MAEGRCYTAIMHLSQQFDYSMLVSLCSNDTLPYTIRAVFFDLTRALCLDVFPQLPFCGRPAMPEKVWVATALGEGDMLNIIRHERGVSTFSQTGSFPSFALEVDSPPDSPLDRLRKSPDELLSFPDHGKFHLLRVLVNIEAHAVS